MREHKDGRARGAHLLFRAVDFVDGDAVLLIDEHAGRFESLAGLLWMARPATGRSQRANGKGER